MATDIGLVRGKNEDYFGAVRVAAADGRPFALWLVADGVGGGPQGELASRTAVESAVGFFSRGSWSDPADALREAFTAANRRVYDITGTGAASTTLVAALVSESDARVWVANVGDSRAYLIVGGQALQITIDHSLVAARVSAGQITPAQARTAPDRNVVTRAIGSEIQVRVDIFGPRQLHTADRLLLCTDGVHGMIDDNVIGRLARGPDLALVAARLVNAANAAGGADNATALVGGPAGPAAKAHPVHST